MEPHEKQRAQVEMWLKLTAELIDTTAQKNENDISKRDIIKIAQKIEDIINVMHGKSKIAGWRL
jgi:hypothetical protein